MLRINDEGKTIDVFAAGETIQMDALADMICQNEEQRKAFDDYRLSYEAEHGEFAEEVSVVKKAAIRKPVTKLTTLKLGADYEVKVLNPEARIEQGEDETGAWWKLYSKR